MLGAVASPPVVPNASVYPSAGDLATASWPIVVAAPGRFSTMTGCPSWVASACVTIRVAMSGAPAGAEGTITRIGLDGNWAAAGHATRPSASAMAAAGVFRAPSGDHVTASTVYDADIKENSYIG